MRRVKTCLHWKSAATRAAPTWSIPGFKEYIPDGTRGGFFLKKSIVPSLLLRGGDLDLDLYFFGFPGLDDALHTL